jgi:hypothetical protein
MRDNPYIEKMSGKPPLEHMMEILEENGWVWDPEDITRTTATFARLYLGRWAQDSGSLAYPYRAYAADGTPHNYAEKLPTVTETGDPVVEDLWRYVIGMDVGFVDSTTYNVLASHPALREQYFVHAEGHSEWLDDQKVERALQLRKRFNDARLVIDPGGGGKNVIETLVTGRAGRPPIPAEVADKPAKAASIRELRDGMIAGLVKFLPDAQPLVDEMLVLGWDEHKLQHDPNGVDHHCDGALYSKRASVHYSYRPGMSRVPPKYGTNAWHEMKRRELLEHFAKMSSQQSNDPRHRRGRYGKSLIH